MSTPISIHQRSYETEAFDEGDGTMRIVGRLVDTKPEGLGLADGEPIVIHDMTIEMVVDGSTFEIRDIRPVMDIHPYRMCTGILDSYRQLIGLSIARGYSRKVKELFGGPNGCSHVGALLIALGPVAVQASWGMARLNEDPADWAALDFDAADAERQVRLNENTCHVWHADGSQIAFLKRGEKPVRPDWETDRLVKLGLVEGPVEGI
ncbi:MAG: DUF2889 domain-containing protein [Actinomycetota bacterium]